jgi:hypothetical protein
VSPYFSSVFFAATALAAPQENQTAILSPAQTGISQSPVTTIANTEPENTRFETTKSFRHLLLPALLADSEKTLATTWQSKTRETALPPTADMESISFSITPMFLRLADAISAFTLQPTQPLESLPE